jgi:pilus assembly protein CpaF
MDDEVTEIIINAHDNIWLEKEGKLFKFNDFFSNEIIYRNFVHRLCREIQQHLTLTNLYASGDWNGFRVQIVGPPIVNITTISLRKRAEVPWTLERFLEHGWASAEQISILKDSLINRDNLFVIGATGSGKTSVLSALLNATHERERSLILEDCAEIPIPNASSLKLLTRSDSNQMLSDICIADLLKLALRLRPDRIVIGEVRGTEAKDLLMAMSTGHKGSMGTLHAHTAKEALLRLEMLIQMGASQWSLPAIRQLIKICIDKIVVIGKDSTGKRFLEGIYKIASLEDFGFLIEKIC